MISKQQTGFTIVELLIVIVVIAILAAISTFAYSGIQERAKDAALLAKMNASQKIIEIYKTKNGFPPVMATNTYGIPLLKDASGVSEIIGSMSNGINDVHYIGYGDTKEFCAASWDSSVGVTYILTQNGMQKYTTLTQNQQLCMVNDIYGTGSMGIYVENAKPLEVSYWMTGA